MTPFTNPEVETVFAAFPLQPRNVLMRLRQLIFDVADGTDGVGTIVECLKWGEPSYLTVGPKSGSTIRIGWNPNKPDHGNVFLNCQTNLIAEIRELYPDEFEYEGSRRLSFELGEPLHEDALQHCFALALTHHTRKRTRSRN